MDNNEFELLPPFGSPFGGYNHWGNDSVGSFQIDIDEVKQLVQAETFAISTFEEFEAAIKNSFPISAPDNFNEVLNEIHTSELGGQE